MNLTDHITPQTVVAIYAHYEARRKNPHRPHLGGSQIGQGCERALFYQFRHAAHSSFDGRMLRLFDTGNKEEDRLIADLRAIGVKVWSHDPDTGKQIRFTAHGGHFALSLDGVAEGIPDAPKTPHTLEFKTMNERNFRAMMKDGVQVAKPVYWAQCQIGMHLSGLDRCAFIAVNKNTDEIHMERLHVDHEAARGLLDKSERIIFTDKPPARISNDPSYYLCKMCSYKEVCHHGAPPEVNCRTCAHATPERDGSWSCALGHAFGKVCRDHIFNPYILGWEIIDAGEGWVEYNGPAGKIRNEGGNSQEMVETWMPF